ncbi:hypothetical protein RBS60_09085 [Sinomonas sp. ASV486]|uniref:hypothetical protein n=1 Tax=Sinomonas sp. ASV486 TaxID=3051170 RepID=UPI0027DCFB2B|nr:hypothetical protein [Sinomonas sp. ASV486]MDQ4490353.1 hypothetical protein [Sinomonas sp. ASV486]
MSLRRRWYVALIGLMLTTVGWLVLSPGQHVYSARVTVTFLPPGQGPVSQSDDSKIPTLVNFAAMVRLALPSDTGSAADRESFGGSLVGAGVRKGFAVLLPNAGGQWSKWYNQPVLSVEAVDATPQDAESQVRQLTGQIVEASADLQTRLQIPPASRVTTSLSAVEVVDGGVRPSTRARGASGLMGLGAFLSVLGAVSVDRCARWAAIRRLARSPIPSTSNLTGARR